jgi:hypothetical protein
MKIAKLSTTLTLIVLGILFIPIDSFSQSGEGNRRDPAEITTAEKKIILDSITGLNDEQKLIIEEIYKDYGSAITTARANADPNNREAMRNDMTSIRNEKNESLKAILTQAQYQEYDVLMQAIREKMGQRRRGNGGQ